MDKRIRIFGVMALSLLTACGGGRGGSTSGPVTSPNSFPASKAIADYVNNGSTFNFDVTGTQTVNETTYNVTGSGTRTVSPATATMFEGQAAFHKTVTVTGTLTVNGTSAPIAGTAQDYYTTNYAALGTVTDTSYCVMQGTASMPANVTVGETAAIGTYTCYKDSSKSTPIGTAAESYVVEPDTEATALFDFIDKTYDNTGHLVLTEQEQWRIDTLGNLTFVSITATGPTTNLSYKAAR